MFGAILEAQRAHFILWLPVFFGLGIAVYFTVPTEPTPWVLAAIAFAIAVLVGTWVRAPSGLRIVIVPVVVLALGFVAGTTRSFLAAAPVLPYDMTVAVEGRLIGLSRSGTDRTRILLDRVVIHGLSPGLTPARVRISVDESTPADALVPGNRLLGQARLSPPGGPGEPGGFDFRRIAWFERIGAVGFTNSPMLESEGSDRSGFHQLTFRVRMALSAHIQARIPDQNGAFAAAILTGDRSALDSVVEEELRLSTLYHIVSIGGLHMSLIAAAVFGFVRYGLALVPILALRLPLKKIAAVAALAVTAAYLAISGFDVAAQRAFLMSSVFLVAILLDRPALTMHSVALSALVVLILAPDSLLQAGFQMSFAGTIALIAAFEALRRQGWWQATQTEAHWRFVKPILATFMTSLVAGAATAPFSTFHFNLLAQYGLLANMLAMPAMGLVVMPAAVAALFLAPFTLDWIGFTAMGWGIDYVLEVASFVARRGGAVVGVQAAPTASLALVSLGGIILVLWIGRARWTGLGAVALGLALWTAGERPLLLVSDDGRLFGYMTPEGRALSTPRGKAYAADGWLEEDGDVADRETAHARGTFMLARARVEAEVPGIGPVVYVGRRDPATGPSECASASILIAPRWTTSPGGGCLFIGAETLRRDGALAISPGPEGLVVEGALSLNTGRPWTRVQAPPAAPLNANQRLVASEN
jgi:competence protein ComEC